MKTLLTALFVTLLVVSNTIAVKIGDFGGFYLSVAILAFPLTYIISDVVTEVYGFAAMRRVIWTGFVANLAAVFFFWLAMRIPPAPFWEGDAAFGQILGAAPRILLASFVGYLVGGFANAVVLAKMKVWQRGRWLPVRTIGSTIVGQGLDSLFFITIAFLGVLPTPEVWKLVVLQWLGKTLLEALITPVTVTVASYLKKTERVDAYDATTSFNPLAF